MSTPPPQDLSQWSKKALAREVERLRALLYEHAEQRGSDPREQSADGSPVTDVAGDPYAVGGAVLDTRRAVLMGSVDVSLVDTGHKDDVPIAFLVLEGRVNYSTDQVQHVYLLDADGAAAVASELTGLAARSMINEETQMFGVQFAANFTQRMDDMPPPVG